MKQIQKGRLRSQMPQNISLQLENEKNSLIKILEQISIKMLRKIKYRLVTLSEV